MTYNVLSVTFNRYSVPYQLNPGFRVMLITVHHCLSRYFTVYHGLLISQVLFQFPLVCHT